MQPMPQDLSRGPRPLPSTQPKRLLSCALAYKVMADGTVDVLDLDFAGFCHMRGLPLAEMVEEGFRRRGQPIRYRFTFQAAEEQIRALSIEYTNSECAQFADCIRRLKKAVRSTGPREG